MSAGALAVVVRFGPDDHKQFRLLVCVADFADPWGHEAVVGNRLLAERSRLTLYGLRQVRQVLVLDDWLLVDDPGDSRRRAVYSLGPRLTEHCQAREIMADLFEPKRKTARGARDGVPESAAQEGGARSGTFHYVKRTVARRSPPWGEAAGAPDGNGRPPSFRRTPPTTRQSEDDRYRAFPNWTKDRLAAEEET